MFAKNIHKLFYSNCFIVIVHKSYQNYIVFLDLYLLKVHRFTNEPI